MDWRPEVVLVARYEDVGRPQKQDIAAFGRCENGIPHFVVIGIGVDSLLEAFA